MIATMTFQGKVNMLLRRNGWTQADLERESKVSDTTISGWLNRGSRPNLENALAVARAFDVSLEFLADDSLEVPDTPSIEQRAMRILVAERGPDGILSPEGSAKWEDSDYYDHLMQLGKRFRHIMADLASNRPVRPPEDQRVESKRLDSEGKGTKRA